MKRLSLIIDLLQNKNFEISKELKNPTIIISNAIPILDFPRSDITCECNFELRARHSDENVNLKVLKIIYKILSIDKFEIKKTIDADIFRVVYKDTECLKR